MRLIEILSTALGIAVSILFWIGSAVLVTYVLGLCGVPVRIFEMAMLSGVGELLYYIKYKPAK